MSAPWIVLAGLVMRADSTADEERRTPRAGYFVNRAGQGVCDPGVEDTTPALAATPAREWEAFDAYWRKTHGPKLIHDEGPEDEVTPLLRFYLQQHRIPSGPTSDDALPYTAQVGDDGLLVSDPEARVRPYARPRFDGLAQLAFGDRADLFRFFDADGGLGKYTNKVVPDEKVFIKGLAFQLCEEHVVIESPASRRDPVLLIKNHVRHPSLSRDTFRELWRGSHAELIASLPEAGEVVRRYTQLPNVGRPVDPIYDEVGDAIDGVSVMAFANMNDLEEFLGGESYAEIARDERDFCSSEYYTAINYVIRDDTVSR